MAQEVFVGQDRDAGGRVYLTVGPGTSHHLYVDQVGSGKNVLLRRVLAAQLQAKAAAGGPGCPELLESLVVVDPLGSLVPPVLADLPAGTAVSGMKVIDLAGGPGVSGPLELIRPGDVSLVDESLKKAVFDGGVFLSYGVPNARDNCALVVDPGDIVILAVDAARKQARRSVKLRCKTLLVVNDIELIPRADFRWMCCEVMKFGVSLVLGVGCLASLDRRFSSTVDTLVANVGTLAVFQASGFEALKLAREFQPEVSGRDIEVLAPGHCYLRSFKAPGDTLGVELVVS